MVIQMLLISTLIVTMAYALRQKSRAPLVSLAAILFGVLGIFFVLMPEATTEIAHVLGVGRGADLLLYCFIMIGMLTVLNLHLRLLHSQEMLTGVAREFAIFRAQLSESDLKDRMPD